MKPTVIIAAAVIGLIRPALLFVEVNEHVQGIYEAAAHILVGILLGVWLLNRDLRVNGYYVTNEDAAMQPWVMRTFWTLTAVELICFAVTVARKFV